MNSYPTPPEAAQGERMHAGFLKLHPGLLTHVFTQPDLGDYHDHPWGFTTHVMEGGYIEEVVTLHPDGTHQVQTLHRLPGTSHQVTAQTLHRITCLPLGFCVTRVEPGAWEQKSGFWRFDAAGAWHRYHDELEFTLRVPRHD